MKHSFWKAMSLLALSLSAGTSYGDAFKPNYDSQVEPDCEKRCNFECQTLRRKVCYEQEEEKSQDVSRSFCFAPLREAVSCWGKTAHVDFLYWGAQNSGGFAYAQEGKLVATNPQEFSIVRMGKQRAPGFRLGIGHEFTHDFWDLALEWTWYKNDVRNILEGSQKDGIFYIPSFVLQGATYQKGTSHWQVSNHFIDLSLGKEYWLSKSFSVRPHWGLSAGWIQHGFSYSFLQTDSTKETPPAALDFIAQTRWFGIGPKAGIHSEWLLGAGFSFLGKANGSALYGNQKIREKSIATEGSSQVQTNMNDQLYPFTPIMQAFVGAQWGLSFNEGKSSFAASAGWEMNYIWDQFPVILFSHSPGPDLPKEKNSLEMGGLTFNIRVGF